VKASARLLPFAQGHQGAGAIGGHKRCKVRDFGECRQAFQKRRGARALGRHVLDVGADPRGDAAEDLARVRRGQRFWDRVRPEANDADAAGAAGGEVEE
jgi:hypothetical protein